jgi:transcriptional regulator with PAS, ATPase and Fis domain
VSQDPKPPADSTRTKATPGKPSRRANSVRVTVVSGPDTGAVHAIPQHAAIIGRAAGADVKLTDPTVSSFHVEITADERGVRVRDLESRNGTMYAGARIDRAVIPSGGTLEVGSTLVRLEVDTQFETSLHDLPAFGELRGKSVAMRELFSTMSRLARTDLAVLLEGETGTGKELAARAIHDGSAHASGPFIVLDCTAIPSTLAESMLFGHEKGAFTGANERRIGIFEAADGGTVFLDEVGELPIELQPKLLRVLERREVVRVGATVPRSVSVRAISATWRDLRTMINQGKFREDLYYRLAQARIAIPALRDRREDVSLLVYHFLKQLPANMQGARAISPDALEELMRREYAGNVRE